VRQRTRELREELALDAGVENWPMSEERLTRSGTFRRTRALVLHNIERGDGDRLVGFALSEGRLRTLLEHGVTEEQVGLDRLRLAAGAVHGEVPWWIGYRVWIGLK
jgi:hypothetical protein